MYKNNIMQKKNKPCDLFCKVLLLCLHLYNCYEYFFFAKKCTRQKIVNDFLLYLYYINNQNIYIMNNQLTVRQQLINLTTISTINRIERLKEITAPEIMIEATENQLEVLKKGIIKITDKMNVLDLEFKSIKTKTGSGGKKYHEIITKCEQTLNYFPNGRFGAFITKST